MSDATPQTPVRLADYTPPAWLVDDVHLTFALSADATTVTSTIRFRPNPAASDRRFFLHGEALTPAAFAIDGKPIKPRMVAGGLEADVPDAPFTWSATVKIDPSANTALSGLYMSNGMFCTQCEAEGFRRITYYPDRPDVMAPFTVRIESDLPVMLSNGNPAARGDGWAEWHDPWPKPAYLFALVAGDLVSHDDSFTTQSGRNVDLAVWVRPGDQDKCAYAMDALKRSMRWDEQTYGREYDLDIFQIVAVDDFNMGAMENKGLNIFNSKYVLASPETATDRDYEMIEGIIAHEYFHNWTGNRITCRDWFQLSLKEGLTVFRDQQFSGDQRSEPVKRIEDVLQLRARQFREDAGPLAHPVRPESYIEINNFYTATIYEKGAEVIAMLRTLVGADGYAKALDLYFDRHDGQACTIEDWLAVFQDATGRDLSQFKRWYEQAGTPRVDVEEAWDADTGRFTLTLDQSLAPTPGQETKAPMVIPVAVGLLSPNGDEVVPTTVLELTRPRQEFHFDGLGARPVASLLRGFSAPVTLSKHTTTEERSFLLAHDTDPFNRWEAGRALAKSVLVSAVMDQAGARDDYLSGLRAVISDQTLDPAFRALALALPSEDDIAQTLADGGMTPDPLQVYAARHLLQRAIGDQLGDTLAGLYDAMAVPGPYSPDATAAGQRALRHAALGYLSLHDGCARATALYGAAGSMTESMAALGALIPNGYGADAVADFYDRWKSDRLVIDKWFALQVTAAPPAMAVEVAQKLADHPDFDWKNPNRFRSLLGGLAANTCGFHDPGGAGYRFYVDWLMKLDPVNPQTTARMTTAFDTLGRWDADRQGMMRAELERLRALPGLSKDTGEMVDRMLGG